MGSFIVDSYSSKKSPNTFMEVNEEADGGTVFTTRLSAGIVQAIPRLLTGC